MLFNKKGVTMIRLNRFLALALGVASLGFGQPLYGRKCCPKICRPKPFCCIPGPQGPMGSPGTSIIASDYIFAATQITQPASGKATTSTFIDVTFEIAGPTNGWSHSSGSANFTCPATGIYMVSYQACVEFFSEAPLSVADIDAPYGGLQAVFGPIGLETTVVGSDTSVAPGTRPSLQNISMASKSFLLSGVAGQNLKIQFLPVSDDTATGIFLASAATSLPTVASITITRIS